MTRLYIAGPMSGYPGYNLPAFTVATNELDACGYVAVNPGERGVIPGYEWCDYMRDGIRLLIECDAVALLHGWQDSRGAQLEVSIADGIGIPVAPIQVWKDAV